MNIFHRLATSYFRRSFSLRKKEFEYLQRKGFDIVREEALVFLSERIAPATPHRDGKQTPMRNHPVFIAQHATATCCRRCVAKWHSIPQGREMSKKEISYCVDIIMEWLLRESTKGIHHPFIKKKHA